MKSFALIGAVCAVNFDAAPGITDYINKFNSPADLQEFEMLQTGASWALNDNKIYDADGDGVEDNVKRSRDELDRFYYPNQYGDAGDDIHNTHHGNLPGHLQLENYEMPPKEHKLYKFAPS